VAEAAAGPLAPGAHLSFGSGDGTMLAEAGPNSGEFFLGNTAAAPLSRSTTRVPLAPGPGDEAEPEGQEQPDKKSKKEGKKESRGARRRRLGIPRRVTPRVLGFLLLVIAVPVAAYFVLRWYAYDNYIVTLQGNQIVVKQGQPGGVLWFHPRVVDHTGVTTSQILPSAVPAVRAGVQESTLAGAHTYVRELRSAATTATTTTTTTSTTGVTTTTLPPVPAGGAP
jgi:hypothetical protein